MFSSLFVTLIVVLVSILCSVEAFRLYPSIKRSIFRSYSSEIDPTFEEHLPSMLKAGLQERPDYDIASQLRNKQQKSVEVKRSAAKILKTANAELAAELEEIADELEESQERFVKAAMSWDAWNRPSPDLPNQLRKQAQLENPTMDPNYEAHLAQFLKKGTEERPSAELPSELRSLRQRADVKRRAATELRNQNLSPALAEELDDLASEMDETHDYFDKISKSLQTKFNDDYPDPSQ